MGSGLDSNDSKAPPGNERSIQEVNVAIPAADICLCEPGFFDKDLAIVAFEAAFDRDLQGLIRQGFDLTAVLHQICDAPLSSDHVVPEEAIELLVPQLVPSIFFDQLHGFIGGTEEGEGTFLRQLLYHARSGI